MSTDLQNRIDSVAESILGNEALTANLDDQAADIFLKWVLACGETIARSTAGLDDAAAEEAMHPRLKALRRLARAIAAWPNDPQVAFDEIHSQAAVALGEAFSPPTQAAKIDFLRQHQRSSSSQIIPDLAALLKCKDRP